MSEPRDERTTWADPTDGEYDKIIVRGRVLTPGSRWWCSQMDPKNWPPKAEERKDERDTIKGA
jgi:hypothetical protein